MKTFLFWVAVALIVTTALELSLQIDLDRREKKANAEETNYTPTHKDTVEYLFLLKCDSARRHDPNAANPLPGNPNY